MATPIALRIVAILFILFGLGDVWMLISGMFSGSLTIGAGVLSLFIGIGLLRHKPLWRDIALALLCLTFAFTALIGGFAVFGEAIPVRWNGTLVSGVERRIVAVTATMLLLVFNGAVIWVLTRANVKTVFDVHRKKPTSQNGMQAATH